MIKYRCKHTATWGSRAEIMAVAIEKETEKSVWIYGCRANKRSEDINYYDTWDEAKTALLSHQQKYINGTRSTLERAKGVLGNIKGLKEKK